MFHLENIIWLLFWLPVEQDYYFNPKDPVLGRCVVQIPVWEYMINFFYKAVE